MKALIFACLAFFYIDHCLAQKVNPRKKLAFGYQLVMENDAFTLDLTTDRYYSSGIFPAVRWLADSIANAKVIRSVQLNHRIYTPRWVGWEQPFLLDRPYAGMVSASYAYEYYFKSNQYLKTQLEIGWMGPGVQMEKMQVTWHEWFGMPEPKGWKYQINDTPIINLFMTYVRPVYSSYHFELSGESNLAAGSVFNYARQEIMIRLGELKPIKESAYAGSFLGNVRQVFDEPTISEIYCFYSPGLEYVFYNATIEGNLIGEHSLYTKQPVRWVWQHRAGVMLSWPRFDLGFIAYWRTAENTDALGHNYVGVRMNQRF